MTRLTKNQRSVRVTHTGPTLPFRVPVIPWWIAVPTMLATVLVVAVVAAVAVVS